MKDQRVIDHLIFRKLFAESFSESLGDNYVVATSGVRWKESEADFIKDFGSTRGASDRFTIEFVEDIIRPASLDFPCSPSQALAWATGSADTWAYVPDWLKCALGQNDARAAVTVLKPKAALLNDEAAAARAKGDSEGARKALRESECLHLAVEAFHEIERLIGATANGQADVPLTSAPSPKVRQRTDLLTDEIIEAIRTLGISATPTEVLGWLKKQAGKQGSCVVRTTIDGVTWRRAGGTESTTSLRAIGERLIRFRRQGVADTLSTR